MGSARAEGTMRGPAWRAGIAPHRQKTGETVAMVYVLARNRTIRRDGGNLLVSCARATRGLRRPSLDARS